MTRRYLVVLLSKMTEPMMRLMFVHLKEAGIPRDEVDVIHVLGDEQPEGAYDRPTKTQLDRTRPAFRDAMERSMPQCVIPVGPEAFRAVTGLPWGIDDARGYVILPAHCKRTTERRQVQVGVFKTGPRKGQPKMKWETYSAPPPLPASWPLECAFRDTLRDAALGRVGYIVPSISIKQFVKQKRRQITALQAAFENARRYGEGAEVDELTSWRERWTEGEDRSVDPGGPLAFDVEAPVGSTMIERFSTSSPRSATYSLPWGPNEREFFQHLLRTSSVNIAHNIQYDVPVLRANGIEVPEPWFDTMIAASLLEPDLPKGLGKVIPIYLLAHPHKNLSAERGYNDPEYSAKDAWTELRLYQEQRAALEEWGMLDLFENRIMRSVPALVDLKERGIAVNARRAEAWCGTLRGTLSGLLHWWDGHFPGVSPSSNKDVTTLLYKTWGLPVQRSKHDGWTGDELALRTLMSIEPKYEEPIKKLLQIRGVSKQLQTYGRALLGVGRVHPSYLPKGKDTDDPNKGLPGTGRLASSGPNIQNQTDEAREVYECDDPDWVFVAGDLSQAELRVMAAKSGDAALLEALESGDVHARTMERIGCDRTLAKNGLYGTSYGAGPKRLVEMLRANGVYTTTAAMRDFQRALARAYPRWWAYLEEVALLGQAQGYLRNSFGRVRRFTAPESDVPAMKDFPPQSDVGDIGWSTYRDLADGADAYGRLSMLIHDEAVIQVRRDRVKEGCDMLRDVMGREFPEVAPGFRIPVNCKVGPQWGPRMVKEDEWLSGQTR